MKKLSIILYVAALLGASSCAKMDLLDNPNYLTPDQANVDYLTNSVQLNFKDIFHEASGLGMQMTRMRSVFGTSYENAYTPSSFDYLWELSYSSFLADAQTLIPLAESNQLYYTAGMTKVMKAYVLMTLVDYFGDVPYTESLNADILNPNADKGAAVYDTALALLDAGIADLGKTSLSTPEDLFYSSAASWVKLANSLKIRAYVQTRLVNNDAKSKLESLVSDGNFITASGDDFSFSYGANNSNPDSRDAWFTNQYTYHNNGEYVGNYFMNLLYDEKGIQDPRLRYYFFRQSFVSSTSATTLPCYGTSKPAQYSANDPYCSIGPDGYWGRDHLNGDGIPPDGELRTFWGVYPAGGVFDADAVSRSVDENSGAKGAGIEPIMQSAYIKFLLAEATLKLALSGQNARTLLEQAVQESIAKVVAFGANDPAYSSSDAPTAADINNYVATVLAKYDGAASDDDKLNVIVKEYLIAAWGNGIEGYNAYRRTGKPAGIQPALSPNPGTFYRSFTYPAAYVNRNSNAVQKTSGAVQVFWDTNPAGFIN